VADYYCGPGPERKNLLFPKGEALDMVLSIFVVTVVDKNGAIFIGY